ncbi:alpha/beta-hydrolase [Xylaria cf. heliscus]|nr:alpha/beta-hydrolase [Xylaria cf. heliscus]
MKLLLLIAALLSNFASTSSLHPNDSTPPTVKTVNGTYEGLYLPGWNQDAFLGMPYAQPPVGQLRYRRPMPVNETFEGVRKATQYGYSCMQYGQTFTLSEDCLTINVVRPAGKSQEPLPVLVWVYGGGLYAGSTADPQYNLSGIVQVSQEMGQPIIAVSMNYRLGQWGFLQTAQLLAEGSSNAGLLDQRLAFHWIQENIAAFGGNPAKVVLWGESAGAQSIAYHLFAYDGRDDNLFRGAILESGGPTGAQIESLTWYAASVENLTRTVGCWGTPNQLACLREVDEATLFAAHPSVVWNPLLDGDFRKKFSELFSQLSGAQDVLFGSMTGYPSQLMQQGKYVKVPILIGANTDEGFAISGTLNTEEDIFNSIFTWRGYALTPPTVRRLLKLYPDDPCHEPPYAITNCSRHPTRGLMWRRAAAIGADLVMISGRRRLATLYAAAGMPVYSYRFDQRPWNGDEWDGVKHFVNVAYSFQNISGLLGPSPDFDSHARLARAIGHAYVSFANHLSPNKVSAKNSTETDTLPYWPVYDPAKPANMVLNATGNHVEADTWRKEGIDFMMTPEVAKELLS